MVEIVFINYPKDQFHAIMNPFKDIKIEILEQISKDRIQEEDEKVRAILMSYDPQMVIEEKSRNSNQLFNSFVGHHVRYNLKYNIIGSRSYEVFSSDNMDYATLFTSPNP